MTTIEHTVRLERSTLMDGRTRWSASLIETPGVVAEGDTEEAALGELLALATDLRKRLGEAVIGFRTPKVGGWSWVWSIGPSGPGDVYGADPLPELAAAGVDGGAWAE